MLALMSGSLVNRRNARACLNGFVWLTIATLHGCSEPDAGSREASISSTNANSPAAEMPAGTSEEYDTDPTPDRSDQIDSSITANTASVHDCLLRLPCRSSIDDDGLTIALSAVDGEALDGSGALRIDLTIESTTRDATVGFDSTTSIISAGQVLSAATLSLGAGNSAGIRDEASTPLVAGLPINGHIVFDGSPSGNPVALDRLALSLREAGVVRSVVFTNVPLGADPAPAVDCELSLPCVWQITDGSASLTLTSAGPLYWNRSQRTAIAWRFDADRSLALIALPGGRAVTASGENLELYGREVGAQESRDDVPLVQPIDANQSETGRFILRRPPASGEFALARIEIALIEQQSLRTPRWRPTFVNVPLSD